MKTQKSIAAAFDDYFTVRAANTEELKKAAYRIRYEVYCQELGWEPSNSAHLEKDQYDLHAHHCLLQHRRTGKFAGCVRLIQTSGTQKVPFEEHCLSSVDQELIDPSRLPRGCFGEISRLAVPATFRKRKNESKSPFVMGTPSHTYSDEERRHFPNIAIGLYLASIACVDLLGLEYVFVMMEPRLRRHLSRFGLPFRQAGAPMEYHGTRALFYLDRENLTCHLPPEIHELYILIYETLRDDTELLYSATLPNTR